MLENFVGDWEGAVQDQQFERRCYTALLTLNDRLVGAPIGECVGKVEYPELGGKSVLVLKTWAPNRLELAEAVFEGEHNTKVRAGATVVLSLEGDLLRFEWQQARYRALGESLRRV